MIKQKKGYDLWKKESLRSVVVGFQSALRARAINVLWDPLFMYGRENVDSPTSLQKILQELLNAPKGSVVPIPKLKLSSLIYLTSKLQENEEIKMTAREDAEALENKAIKEPDTMPVNLQETSNFSFQHSFAIVAHPNGGFVIQQMFVGKRQYSRAFSGLEDLTAYLISQKEAFMMMEDQS